ncbi:hypothetical protein [Nonomuraea sp. NPDC050786]|uniref:hypothetical protein n=1 Tax=Nonomuraea sp. NPDC050786 TaxID=3154840 RepID=UPI0033EA8B47
MTNRGRSSALPPFWQLGLGIALAAIGVLLSVLVVGGVRPQQQGLLLVDARGQDPRSMAAPAALKTIDPADVDGLIMFVDNLQLWSACFARKDGPVCRAVTPFAKDVWFFTDPQADGVLRMLSLPARPLAGPRPVAVVGVGPKEGRSALPGLLSGAAATVLGCAGALVAAAALRRMRRRAAADPAGVEEREPASRAPARPSGSYPPHHARSGGASDPAHRAGSGTGSGPAQPARSGGASDPAHPARSTSMWDRAARREPPVADPARREPPVADPARREPPGADPARRDRPGRDPARQEGSGSGRTGRERPGTTTDPAYRTRPGTGSRNRAQLEGGSAAPVREPEAGRRDAGEGHAHSAAALGELRAMAERDQPGLGAVARTHFGPDGGYVQVDEVVAWARPADPGAPPIVAGEHIRLVGVDEVGCALVVARAGNGYGGKDG